MSGHEGCHCPDCWKHHPPKVHDVEQFFRDPVCKHGVSELSASGCYNCVIEENEHLEAENMMLTEEVELLKDAMMAELPDNPKRPNTAKAYADEFVGCAESWEKTVRLALEERDKAKADLVKAQEEDTGEEHQLRQVIRNLEYELREFQDPNNWGVSDDAWVNWEGDMKHLPKSIQESQAENAKAHPYKGKPQPERDRVAELKLELKWAKIDLRNLLSLIEDHKICTDDSEDSCIRSAMKRCEE